MREGRFDFDAGRLLFGAIVLVVGGYYLLTKTFGVALPELNWDVVWPLFVVALGAGILWRALGRADAPSR